MKALLVTALLALSFTTGFTCSKNAPEASAPNDQTAPATAETTAPAAPAEATTPAPTDAAAATTAPAEGQPTQPATETK